MIQTQKVNNIHLIFAWNIFAFKSFSLILEPLRTAFVQETERRRAHIKQLSEELKTCKDPEEKKRILEELRIEDIKRLQTNSKYNKEIFGFGNR